MAGDGRTILNRVLPAIDALTQIARLADGFERRPIRPSTDGEAMFAAAQAVVENKCTRAGSCDADTETARCLGALDNGARKVGDTIPFRRDWQTLDRLFVKFDACQGACVRTMSAQSIYRRVCRDVVHVMWCLQECQ